MKIKRSVKRIAVYIAIVIGIIIINILLYLYVSYHFISNIGKYLSENISFLFVRRPIIMFSGIFKAFAIDLFINIFLVLIIMIVIISLFQRRLKKAFKINNVYTIKKIIILAIIIIGIQMIISLFLWHI